MASDAFGWETTSAMTGPDMWRGLASIKQDVGALLMEPEDVGLTDCVGPAYSL
jgi:hypothetical protein